MTGIHRCEQAEGADADLALICRWVAFNSLYGQWDAPRREPRVDRECWRQYLDRLLAMDDSGHIAGMLQAQRELVIAMLDDAYLSPFFWQDPTDRQASKARKARYDARTWYVEKQWGMLLDRLLERVYLMRCQLMHGAASFGSRLNRTSLARCNAMMARLIEAVLLAMIDHGEAADWGLMCYPPLENHAQA
jgi:hypothetical protein